MNERAEVRKRESADRGEGRDSEGATTALAPRVARGGAHATAERVGRSATNTAQYFLAKKGRELFCLT